jgi:hypothetical protein
LVAAEFKFHYADFALWFVSSMLSLGMLIVVSSDVDAK